DEKGHVAEPSGSSRDDGRGHRLHDHLRGLSVGMRRRLLQGDQFPLHQVRSWHLAMVETAQKQWYIVHTYSGFEERVREKLNQRIDALGMRDKFGEIKIPTETL